MFIQRKIDRCIIRSMSIIRIYCTIDKRAGKYVTDGRAWNCRIVSFMFLNGTADIAADGERESVRQAFQLWQQQAGLIFREVFNENEADIRISWGNFEKYLKTGYH